MSADHLFQRFFCIVYGLGIGRAFAPGGHSARRIAAGQGNANDKTEDRTAVVSRSRAGSPVLGEAVPERGARAGRNRMSADTHNARAMAGFRALFTGLEKEVNPT